MFPKIPSVPSEVAYEYDHTAPAGEPENYAQLYSDESITADRMRLHPILIVVTSQGDGKFYCGPTLREGS